MSVIGLKVGPFEIVGPAFVPEPGSWYLARRAGLTRKQPESVLVRMLPGDALPDERAAVLRQYEALKGIEDSRVPQPVAYYEGMGALAIDAVSGAPLLDAVRRVVPVSQATLLDVLLEVAETLQRVHHRNRHHGHLDPEQIVLAPDGAVWLFGFGSPDGPPDPRWIPPERARGEPVGPLTDQWSLGVVALLLADPQGEVDALERSWPALGRLVRRMCDPHPANRFPSMHPVRQELLALARRIGGTSDRRALAQRLGRERGAPAAVEDPPSEPTVSPATPPPAPPPAPAAPPPVAQAAAPVVTPTVVSTPTAATATPTSIEATPRIAPWRRPPDEEIPVVRPDVSGEIPLASLGRPDVPDEPEPVPAPAPIPEPAPAAVPEPLPPATVRPEMAAVWRETPDPSLETAPTVVPLTDSGELADPGTPDLPMSLDSKPDPIPNTPSVSEAWFELTPSPAPDPDPSLGLGGISPVLPSAEPGLPGEDDEEVLPRRMAEPTAPPFPIQRVAPVLALVFGGLVLLWLLTVLW